MESFKYKFARIWRELGQPNTVGIIVIVDIFSEDINLDSILGMPIYFTTGPFDRGNSVAIATTIADDSMLVCRFSQLWEVG